MEIWEKEPHKKNSKMQWLYCRSLLQYNFVLLVKILFIHKIRRKNIFLFFAFYGLKGFWRHIIINIQLISYKMYFIHSFNGEYLSFPKCTGSCGYLFHEIPSITLLCYIATYNGLTNCIKPISILYLLKKFCIVLSIFVKLSIL